MLRMSKILKAMLTVNFCNVEFENPFVLAASPCTDDIDMVRRAFEAGWAGAVLKTTSVEKTPVDLTYPIISGVDFDGRRLCAMGNTDLISEHHIDEIEKRTKKLKKEFPEKCVIISITGQDERSWKELAGRAADCDADMIECSFSCPQGTIGLKSGMMLAQDRNMSAKVARWIKDGAGMMPVVIKLTPLVTDIAEVAKAVVGAGADAVCVGNTFPSLLNIDLDSHRTAYSGLSGHAIKPISLRCICECAKAGAKVAGSGGPVTWHDALEFMLMGAGIVQFCTAVMKYGFVIIEDLCEGMIDYLEERKISSPMDLIGKCLNRIVLHDDLQRVKDVRARIDLEKCVHCGDCFVACRDGGHQAIEFTGKREPRVDDEKCVGCGLCESLCPVTECIKLL